MIKTKTVEKPWGCYTDYYRTDSVVFKRLVVNPGEELSFQLHNKRDEFWYIKSGKGTLKLNNSSWRAKPGMHFHIKQNESHQLINAGDEKIIVFEMQFGTCLEEDIVRLEDKYGRQGESGMGAS